MKFSIWRTGGWFAAALSLSAVFGTGATAQTPTPPDTAAYRGALPPADPQQLPPAPLGTGVEAALDVLYERPSPEGPPPIPVAAPKALYAEGRGPVLQVLPGELVYAEHVPQRVRVAAPKKGPFSNNVVQLSRGDIRFIGFDRTVNDTNLSQDSLELQATFTDKQGARWRVEMTRMAPLSPDPAKDPWYGGVAIDTTLHGETGRNTPLEPKVQGALAGWGWGDVYKNDKRVGSGVLVHVMLTSDTRDRSRNWAYAGYDVTERPVTQIHLIIPPSAYLPSPGGFLHLMWQNSEVTRGTPEQVMANAPSIGPNLPTVVINAVPYLKWSQEEVRLEPGKKYRLLLNNNDPTVWHAFHLHGGGHGGSGASAPEFVIPVKHGSPWTTTMEFPEAGRFEYGCPVMNHERRGMKGYFIVGNPPAESESSSSGHSHGR